MNAKRFDPLRTLTNNKTNWSIKVRLTRLWNSHNVQTGNFKGYNMIFLDDDSHIHAYAGMDFVGEIKETPKEGNIYAISNFNVADSKPNYSVVRNKKIIYFLKNTCMQLIKEDDEMILKHKFELVAFNSLKSRIRDTKYLTDVMGLLQKRYLMSSRNTAKGTKDILLIDITDGSEKVNVTVWDPLATILNEELNKISDKGNIIMVITSCKITEYEGVLQASTYSPSKFYINPDYDAVYPLRYRLLNSVTESSVSCETISATDCSIKKIGVYKLEDIIKLRNTDLEELEVICHVKVSNVDINSKWWYYSCDTCPTEVDENYKCDSCDLKIVSIPDKRFKVPMHVSDGSETIQVFLLDREVRRLISRSVDNFFGHDDKDLQYPTILKEIEGKSLTLTVSLNKENLLSGSTIYYASDVIEDIETSPNSPALEKTEQNYTLESNSGKYDGSDPSKSTPQSNLSSNKRLHPTDDEADDKNKKKSV
ncbi:hypothetical protein POM88_048663 [Heracleum sosnowskyi]|uniref:Replication protein A 70 kDa DNA-binding subunit B/D first OB fold domain-containing protein n=1 Tax=Heracleum sosnowskyi TaxID=360622 RepID=A0AAD8GW97_9APIA|nr:hypothetical protein POM88_048663 [Heracleum sosnowskyi]